MAEKGNELFEMLVKITGDNSVAKKTLADLKKDVKSLDKQMQGMELGSKEFGEAKNKLTSMKLAIQSLNQPTDTMIRSQKKAQHVMYNLNRVVQDMPYGLMGVANNVDVLQESFVRLRKEQGSVKGALGALMGALTGPTGIMLGVSAVTAVAVAFGDVLLNAIKGSEEKVEDLNERLEGLQQYKNFDMQVSIAGMSGIERLRAELEQLMAIKSLLEGSERVDTAYRKAVDSRPDRATSLFKSLLPSGFSQAMNEELEYRKRVQRADNERIAYYKKLADEVLAGRETYGKYDIELLTAYGKMSEEDAERLVATYKAQHEIDLKKIEINEQIVKDRKEQEEEAEKARKKEVAERKKLLSQQQRLLREREKEQEALLKAQESVYTSMISNIETMIIDDLTDLEIATQGLQSGPISERYDALIAAIDDTIPSIVDELIRTELRAVRQKLVLGQPLTSANASFLEQYGGVTKYDAAFLGRVGKARSSIEDQEDKIPKKLSEEWGQSIKNIGEDFENASSQAFTQSVSLFSLQLAAAIMQGGQTFSNVLTSVATVFGQMLMQFVIEALTKQAASGLLGLLGLAEGSPAAPPGYTWVGEKGPELVRFQGGEEVIPNNQVGRRLDALYNAGLVAQDFGRSGDVSSIINALDRQTRAMLKDRLNYEITDRGSRQIARATKKRESQIKRYTGS